MTVVLTVSNTGRLAPFTGLFAGALVATYISLEAPLSGMSMNPARTFASAVPAQIFTALWVYFTAPLLGMLLAAEVYLRRKGPRKLSCAKLHHQNDKRCIFCGKPGVSRPRPGESDAHRDGREEASCDTTRSLSGPAREVTPSPRS